jgi:site-specific DNA-cytosine methylase
LVICENVSGLLKRNRGCEPQIHFVRMAFEELGYAFAYTQLDARNFMLLQRRTRIWMWAIRSDVAAAPAAGEVLRVLVQFERPQPAPLDKFLRHVASDKQARQTINEREQAVLECVIQERALQLQPEELLDLVIDTAESVSRAPWCVQATPCVLPNAACIGGASSACWAHVSWLLCKAYGLAISLRSSHGASRISGRWW